MESIDFPTYMEEEREEERVIPPSLGRYVQRCYGVKGWSDRAPSRRGWAVMRQKGGEIYLSETPYLNGSIHGTSRACYQDGSYEEEVYRHGHRISKRILDNDGASEYEEYLGAEKVLHRQYDKEGRLVYKLDRLDNQDGRGAEVFYFYHDNGNLAVEECRGDGKKYCKAYYKNGVLEAEEYYSDSRFHGVWRRYYPDGLLACEVAYHRGKRHGVQKIYSRDGALRREIVHEDGRRMLSREYGAEGVLEHIYRDDAQRVYGENGSLLAYVPYKDGKPHGEAIFYDSKGRVRKRLPYKQGKIDGVMWEKVGRMITKLPFKEGKCHGVGFEFDGKKATKLVAKDNVIEYYADGELWRETIYKDGEVYKEITHFEKQCFDVVVYKDEKFHRREWYSHNILKSVTFYQEGKTISRRYDENGVLAGERYNVCDGKRRLERSYKNGTPHTEESSIMWGLPHGINRTYHPNGKLDSDFIYKNGIKHGVQRVHYDNGKIWLEADFKDGVRDGASREYYRHGVLELETHYRGDVGHGVMRRYYEDGALACEGHYHEGVMVGEWRFYMRDGKMSAFVLPRKDGVPIEGLLRKSKWGGDLERQYYPDGMLRSEELLLHGEILKSKQEYYPNGNLAYTHIREDNIDRALEWPSLVRRYYYPNGELWIEIPYKEDKVNGEKRYYRPDGVLECSFEYVDDEVCGRIN